MKIANSDWLRRNAANAGANVNEIGEIVNAVQGATSSPVTFAGSCAGTGGEWMIFVTKGQAALPQFFPYGSGPVNEGQ